VRKYTGEPYFNHCRAVARLVQDHTNDDDAVAAAFLHDVLEDTDVTHALLVSEFGPVIAQLVHEVTDQSKPEDGNREVRKAIDRAHLAKASPLGKAIKLADLIDNTGTIVAHDPKFAKAYLREKELLLDRALIGSASKELYNRARYTLQNAKSQLGIE